MKTLLAFILCLLASFFATFAIATGRTFIALIYGIFAFLFGWTVWRVDD